MSDSGLLLLGHWDSKIESLLNAGASDALPKLIEEFSLICESQQFAFVAALAGKLCLERAVTQHAHAKESGSKG